MGHTLRLCASGTTTAATYSLAGARDRPCVTAGKPSIAPGSPLSTTRSWSSPNRAMAPSGTPSPCASKRCPPAHAARPSRGAWHRRQRLGSGGGTARPSVREASWVQSPLHQGRWLEVFAVVVHEVEGEYRELVVPVGDHGSLQAPEIRVAFAGRERRVRSRGPRTGSEWLPARPPEALGAWSSRCRPCFRAGAHGHP